MTYFESKAVDDLFHAIDKKQKVYETSLEFSKQKNDQERVAFAYNLLENENIFANISTVNSEKDAKTAAVFRNDGNLAFQKKKDAIALKLYNKSMCYAPLNKKEYALAVGNRSAVNFSMRCYNACLKDIDEALRSGYPKDLHFKLICRKVKCLIAQQNQEEAYKAVKDAEEIVHTSQQDPQKSLLNQLHKDLKNMTSKLDENKVETESPEDCLRLTSPECSFGPNSEILCASNCIELKYNAEFGRHVVATQDINPGDVLIVEKPFASVLLADSYSTHCYHCLQRCFSPVPCHHCALVIFCDETCRKNSWEQTHKIDCSLLPTVSKYVGKMGLLALKVLLTAVNKESDLLALHKKTLVFEKESKDPRILGFDSNNHYVSNNYHTIHSLIGNTELRTNDDLFRRAIIAGCVLYCLNKLTNFFAEICEIKNNLENLDPVNLKFFAGGLLLRYLQSIPCNAHEVSELVFTSSTVDEKTAVSHDICEIGAGLYAALSLLNHSCDPNAVRFSYLDSSVLRAIRNIKAGEQVVDNYGYHYALHNLKERRQPLQQQYFFTCGCEPCTENWPLYKDLPNNPAIIICSCGLDLQDLKIDNGLVKCVCGTESNIVLLKSQIASSVKKYSDTISKVFSEPPKRRNDEEIQEVLSHLILLGRVKRPWRHYGGCQELLKMYFLLNASHCIFSN